MKTAKNWQAGYTIVETMIFLVISAALLLSAVGLFGPRIGNTQFSHSVQELATRIRSISNEAATGTYPSSPAFACSIDASTNAPQISTAASADQGTRNDCIFVGKVINFTVKGSTNCADPIADKTCEKVDVYTAVGRREVDPLTHSLATTLVQSNPRLVLNPSLTDQFTIGYGTHVTALYQVAEGGALTPVNSAGFFQSFGGGYGANGNLTSGSQNITVWGLKTSVAGAQSRTDQEINADLSNTANLLDASKGGLLVCVQGGTSSRKASVSIGSVNESFTTSVTMDDGRC